MYSYSLEKANVCQGPWRRGSQVLAGLIMVVQARPCRKLSRKASSSHNRIDRNRGYYYACSKVARLTKIDIFILFNKNYNYTYNYYFFLKKKKFRY